METSLKEISDRHRLIMMGIVLEGMTDKEVTEKFEISQTRLTQLKKSPLWKKESKSLVDSHLEEHKGRMRDLVTLAIDTLAEAMTHGYVAEIPRLDSETGEEIMVTSPVFNPPATRVNAAEKLLDRVGLGKGAEQHESGNVTIQLYAPGWANDSGKGEIVDITVEK